jgi:hypothetical protein
MAWGWLKDIVTHTPTYLAGKALVDTYNVADEALTGDKKKEALEGQSGVVQKKADETRAFGDKMSNFYGAGGARAQGYYDGAERELTAARGAPQPTYLQGLFGKSQGAGPNQSAGANSAAISKLGGRSKLEGDYYSGGMYADLSKPSASQGYMDSMMGYGNSSTNANTRYAMAAGTKNPTFSADRYASRAALGGPKFSEDALTAFDRSGATQDIKDTTNDIRGMEDKVTNLRFDPTQTQAIGDLYHNTVLPQQQNQGYLEQFYEASANGTNPYYDRLRDTTSKAMERRAAAGGSFHAGESMRQQGEALSDLSAKEYEERAKMAGEAQQARTGRLQALTGEAKLYEDSVLGNRNFNLDVGKEQDNFALSKAGLRLKGNEDSLAGEHERGLLAGQADDASLRSSAQIDVLSKNASEEDLDYKKRMDALASSADTSEYNKRHLTSGYLTELDNTNLSKTKTKIGAADSIDKSEVDRSDARVRAAKNASDEEWRQKDYLRNLAKDASDEQGSGLDRVDAQNKAMVELAGARAGIDMDMTARQGKALTDAEVSAISLELQAAGLDAAAITAAIDSFKSTLELGTKIYTASQGGK